MSTTRRRAVQALAAAALAPHGLAWSQQGTIKVLVGFPPAGLPDLVARALADSLGRQLGTPAVVENRPGANGRLAAQAVKAAAPHGRTLLVVPASGMVHLPHVFRNLGYDPFNDFTPVAQLVENDFAFSISPKLPAKTLAEFAAWCRGNPDAATYGSPGQGSAPHLMGATLAKALDAPMRHVPYKGNAFAINDLAGGHITGIFTATTLVGAAHKAGNVRVLATTGRRRNAALPDVPTFAEAGVPALSMTEGIWVLAPARTPAALVEKLSIAAAQAAHSAEMKAAIQDQAIASPLAPQMLAGLMRDEFERRGAAIRASGFTPND